MPRKKKITKNSPQEEKFVPQEEKFVPQEEEFVPQEEESLQQLGQKIREARIAKNLSLESVSGQLHIAVKILEAIEEGNPEKGPTPVFFRGLVRTYCQFLELDKADFIEKLDKQLRLYVQDENLNIDVLKPVFRVNESFPIRNILTLIVILFGGSIIYYIFFNKHKFCFIRNNKTKY